METAAELETVCECCLDSAPEEPLRVLTGEYVTLGVREVYWDMLVECFDLSLPCVGEKSTLICEACVRRLRHACSFKRLVVETQRVLNKARLDKSAEAAAPAHPGEVKTEQSSDVDAELEVDALEEHVFDNSDEEGKSDQDAKTLDAFDSEDDAPLADSRTSGSAPTLHPESKRDTTAAVKAVKSKRLSEETLALLPPSLRRTMLCLVASEPRRRKPRAKTNPRPAKRKRPPSITIPVKGTKEGEKRKHLRIRLNPNHLKEGKAIPNGIPKPVNVNLALNTHEMQTQSASMLLQYSNVTPFKGTKEGEKRKNLRIRLNPNYVKEEKAIPQEIPKPVNVNLALNTREMQTQNASMFLQYSNVTPFKGKTLRGYRCYYCSAHLSPEELRRHTRREHLDLLRSGAILFSGQFFFLYLDVAALACALCSQTTPDLPALRAHLTDVHGKRLHPEFDDRQIPFVLASDDALRCLRCERRFVSFRSLEFHMNAHYRNCICEVCGDGFIEPKRLNNHRLTHASDRVPCGYCPKIFNCNHKRNMHETAVHHTRPRFQCPACPAKLVKHPQLLAHLEEAHGVPRAEHRCRLCGRVFTMLGALNLHVRKDHMRERNYACGVCDYRASQRYLLNMHMARHTAQRPHRCTVCDKSYPRRKTLLEHMKIHNGDRRFVCSACGQTFVQNCSLRSHLKSHHPEVADGKLDASA